MGRSDTQKVKLLHLKQFLLENTDENHSVKTADIIKYLNGIGIPVERKTVYTDIETLKEYEENIKSDIVIDKNNKTGEYRIISRDFELTDLQLMIDSIQTSQFITQDYADELTEKIKKLVSEYGRKTLNRRCFSIKRVRSMNNNIFWQLDEIFQSIEEDKKICIGFWVWIYTNVKKKGRWVRDFVKTEYAEIFSPIALIWNNNRYYLFAKADNEPQPLMYRLDKMTQIHMSDEQREGIAEYTGREKIKEIRQQLSNLISAEDDGKFTTVKMLINASCTSCYEEVVDRFGDSVKFQKSNIPDYVIATFKTKPNIAFYCWVLSLDENAKIVSPKYVGENIAICLYIWSAMYGDVDISYLKRMNFKPLSDEERNTINEYDKRIKSLKQKINEMEQEIVEYELKINEYKIEPVFNQNFEKNRQVMFSPIRQKLIDDKIIEDI